MTDLKPEVNPNENKTEKEEQKTFYPKGGKKTEPEENNKISNRRIYSSFRPPLAIRNGSAEGPRFSTAVSTFYRFLA